MNRMNELKTEPARNTSLVAAARPRSAEIHAERAS
jgi:hypothetical protein